MADLISSLNKTYPVQPTNVQTKTEAVSKPETEKSKSYKTTGILLGASALAAAAIGGILLHNSAMTKKAAKLAEELGSDIQKIFIDVKKHNQKYTELFDPEITAKYLDEASNLPLKEKIAKLKELKKLLSEDRGLSSDLMRKSINISELPKPVQEAIASKDHVVSSKLYGEFCDTLFYKSKTAGSNIAESVENVFGKGSPIKPHTYDLSKEFDNIVTMDNASGFRSVIVNKQNMVPSNLNRSVKLSYNDYYEAGGCVIPEISKGVKDGKAFVTLKFPSLQSSDVDVIPNAITLLSANSKLTPAQKDLLKICEKMTKEDEKLLGILTFNDGSFENYKDVVTNYDAILSFIQTVANRV